MPARYQTKFTTIVSGAAVSAAVDLSGGDLFGLWVPVLTSGSAVLLGSFDATSANFVRMTNPAGSGDWTFGVGPGSRAVTLQDVAFPFPFLKVETLVTQADTRSLALIAKLR